MKLDLGCVYFVCCSCVLFCAFCVHVYLWRMNKPEPLNETRLGECMFFLGGCK
jgi:hypothetical protein